MTGVSVRMSAILWKILSPLRFTVPMTLMIRQYIPRPSAVRNPPAIFWRFLQILSAGKYEAFRFASLQSQRSCRLYRMPGFPYKAEEKTITDSSSDFFEDSPGTLQEKSCFWLRKKPHPQNASGASEKFYIRIEFIPDAVNTPDVIWRFGRDPEFVPEVTDISPPSRPILESW